MLRRPKFLSTSDRILEIRGHLIRACSGVSRLNINDVLNFVPFMPPEDENKSSLALHSSPLTFT